MNHLERKLPLILVVDDQPQVLDEVAGVLAAAGWASQCCTTAEAAITMARLNPPDLIISAISLRGYSGLEMCQRIKEDESLKDVPVMFPPGNQAPDIIRRSHAAGGSYYLRKPLDAEVLVELIDKALWSPHLAAAHAR
jgi:CheY-like chemotaxis protein